MLYIYVIFLLGILEEYPEKYAAYDYGREF